MFQTLELPIRNTFHADSSESSWHYSCCRRPTMLTHLLSPLLLLLAIAVPSLTCPRNCTCSSYTYMVLCKEDGSHTSFHQLIEALPDNTTSLYIYDQVFEKVSLTASGKSKFASLTHLYIEGSGVKRIKKDFFAAAPKLEKLYLSNNHIKHIKHIGLEKLSSLIVLDLKANKIEDIPPSLFSSLPQLSFIDLSGNQLQSINPHVFNKHSHFTYLSLRGNPMCLTDKQMSELKTIYKNIKLPNKCPTTTTETTTSIVSTTSITSTTPDSKYIVDGEADLVGDEPADAASVGANAPSLGMNMFVLSVTFLAAVVSRIFL